MKYMGREKKSGLLAVFLMVCCCASSSKAQQTLLLADHGMSRYRIVIPLQATPQEIRAAGIFQDYFCRMTNVKLPVVGDSSAPLPCEVRIGRTRSIESNAGDTVLKSLQNDGFRIRTEGQALCIYGGAGKGVIYGVVSLLEDQWGCRKLSPDAEEVPLHPLLSLDPLDIKEVPPAGIRIVNGSLPYDEDYRDWRKLAVLDDFWNDGNWQGYYVHTFDRLVPADLYFTSHPEYFSLVNGSRIPYGQLCLSNPEVLNITIARLKEEMAAHPGILYWSVSQNDNYDHCQCDQCKRIDEEEQSAAGTLIRFVNQVAKAFPDKVITTLAYQYSRKPPALTRPEKNVMITLCTIELNRSQPIETDPGSASFAEDIRGWSRITDRLMIWDYEVQFTNYLCPFPLFHTLQPNLGFFTKYHAVAHFQQCNVLPGNEFAELKSYYLSKLLWNPYLNGDSVIHDFMHCYYGQAAPYVIRYFDLLHQSCRESGQGLDIYGSPVHYAKTFLSQDMMTQYKALFDQAENAVSNDTVILARVKVARLPLQFAEMEIGKSDLFGPRGWYERSSGHYTVKPAMRQLLEDFYACCKKNGVLELNENNLLVDDYYRNTLRFTDVEVEGNLAFQKPVLCDPSPDARYLCNGPATLTNGVKGTDDYRINWLGWEGCDVVITLDLEQKADIQQITLSTLQYPKSWIIHPEKVKCSLSADNVTYEPLSVLTQDPVQTSGAQTHDFSWDFPAKMKTRYIRFEITATKTLPAWHHYTGNKSWVFIDEIVVK